MDVQSPKQNEMMLHTFIEQEDPHVVGLVGIEALTALARELPAEKFQEFMHHAIQDGSQLKKQHTQSQAEDKQQKAENKDRIKRDAFIFLTPKSEKQKDEFAQCGPCRMFVPGKYLDGTGDKCILHGSKQEVGEYYSCGFFASWPTPEGSPVENVVKAHAKELLKTIPGSVTAKDSGLVDRKVQCQRCIFAKEGAMKCGLYVQLNEGFPETFDLDEAITPNSCCNAQEPIQT
jgi:hypothetical protein